MTWTQNYNPLGNALLSTLVAATPIVVLLGSIAFFRIRAHFSALLGLSVAMAVALWVCQMPLTSTLASAAYGAAYGLFPIGWIVLNLIFLYRLTVDQGLFPALGASLAKLAPDPRIQVILVAYCFGAFLEGAAGFGTPVAVTAAILISLGFRPLQASGLALIANTAPVAFGSIGTPIIAISTVTGLDLLKLSAMVGRQLPVFSLLVPFWVVCAFGGWRALIGVWPAALTAGLGFAIPQFLVSNFHGPWLVDLVSSLCSMGALAGLLMVWRPREQWSLAAAPRPVAEPSKPEFSHMAIVRAWVPWLILTSMIFIWGIPQVRDFLNGETVASGGQKHLQPWAAFSRVELAVPKLHQMVQRVLPVAPPNAPPEKALFVVNWLSATGTGILIAAILASLAMRLSIGQFFRCYGQTILRLRLSLLTIATMLALGYVTKYSGTDAILGLALAKTGVLYPFFGTMLGWLGVALTGSDTASNVLFGSLQKITAEQTGLSPILMCAANSTGGVMGKMVDPQSIVVASTATGWFGQEGPILRYVFLHSVALAALVGLLVFLQAKVPPFISMVVR